LAKADTRGKQVERVAQWCASQPLGKGLSPDQEFAVIIANPRPKRLEAYRQLFNTFPPEIIKIYAAWVDLLTMRSAQRRPRGSREQEDLLFDFAELALEEESAGRYLNERQLCSKLRSRSKYTDQSVEALLRQLKRARKSWADQVRQRFPHRTSIDPVYPSKPL
jgi:hypothetical protein